MKKHVLIAVLLIGGLLGVQSMQGVQFAGAQSSPSGSPSGSPSSPPASPKPLIGWAWSSNIGPVKFNIPSSAVTLQSNGALSGYAFSSHIGLIKFGGLSGFPTGGGTVAANATIVNPATGVVTGWARACEGTQSGDCSSMTSRTDGWDGWISLAGTASGGTYGVTMNPSTGAFSGHAWGGDVVGVLNFNLVSCPTCAAAGAALAASCSVASRTDNPNGTATVTFEANASGGTPAYQYKWGTAAYGSSNLSIPMVYNQGTTPGVALLVRDSAASPATVAVLL